MQIWNVKNILDWAINYFRRKDISQPRLSAELLLSLVLKLNRINLYLNYNRVLKKDELALYKKYILKRLENVPIQYISKEAHFRKIKLHVNNKVLIPRPETELLVDKAFEILKDCNGKGKINILEVGTGSGAISISMAFEIADKLKTPDDFWEIIATDSSPDALGIAEENARDILGKNETGRIKFIECDVVPAENQDFYKQYKNKINLVVSNPPYISEKDYKNLPPEIKEYEPEAALLAGKTGLEVYRKILNKIKPYLSRDFCYILLEVDPAVGTRLKKISGDIIGPHEINIYRDYNKRDRVMVVKV
ncbi:MAG: peptide chain release factor N(5)-glutamine methyltransferase [Actinomycetota bacterium]|nr:peptide chain release factor N(5)-glutamine methyltransferase [Actinomycetota bacterium]